MHAQAKAEKLIKALGNERNNRIQKEKLFVELLQEERTARLQVFAHVCVCVFVCVCVVGATICHQDMFTFRCYLHKLAHVTTTRAHIQAEAAMKTLESKLDSLANVMGVSFHVLLVRLYDSKRACCILGTRMVQTEMAQTDGRFSVSAASLDFVHVCAHTCDGCVCARFHRFRTNRHTSNVRSTRREGRSAQKAHGSQNYMLRRPATCDTDAV